MLEVMLANASTIIVGMVVAALIVLIVVKMIRDKRKGKSSCGCSCANCPSAGACHTKQ